MGNICDLYPNIVRPSPYDCAHFIDCSKSRPGFPVSEFVKECEYPQLFSVDTMECEHFDRVQCTIRHEPRAPCKYNQGHLVSISIVPSGTNQGHLVSISIVPSGTNQGHLVSISIVPSGTNQGHLVSISIVPSGTNQGHLVSISIVPSGTNQGHLVSISIVPSGTNQGHLVSISIIPSGTNQGHLVSISIVPSGTNQGHLVSISIVPSGTNQGHLVSISIVPSGTNQGHECHLFLLNFFRDSRFLRHLSGSLSVQVFVTLSVSQSIRLSELYSVVLWDIDLKYVNQLCLDIQIKFDFCYVWPTFTWVIACCNLIGRIANFRFLRHLSVSLSVLVFVPLSVCQSIRFSELFSVVLWDIDLKYVN